MSRVIGRYKSVVDQINKRTSESREYNKKIQESSGLERHGLREEKKEYGRTTRHLLLTHAFLRQVPYKRVERHTEDYPSSSTIAMFVADAIQEIKSHGLIEEVSNWLSDEAIQEAAE